MTIHSMNRWRAFTIVEILACLLLFSMGFLAIIGVFLYGMKTASQAQVDATAWSTAQSVLKDPMPLGADSDPGSMKMVPWSWSKSGNTWIATDISGAMVWQYTVWPTSQPADITVTDMMDPKCNNAAFTGGTPSAGCAAGWLNGYYVQRREQSLQTDIIANNLRLVEVRVDVYQANFGYGTTDSRPLASAVDRVVRNGGL